MTRRLVVARTLEPALAGDRALLLLGLAEDGSDYRVAGAIPAAGSDIAAIEAILPWPLRVVGWTQAGSDEDPPPVADGLPVSYRGEWQVDGEPIAPEYAESWHDGLALIRARLALSSDANALAATVADLDASLEDSKAVFLAHCGNDLKALGASFFSPLPLIPPSPDPLPPIIHHRLVPVLSLAHSRCRGGARMVSHFEPVRPRPRITVRQRRHPASDSLRRWTPPRRHVEQAVRGSPVRARRDWRRARHRASRLSDDCHERS